MPNTPHPVRGPRLIHSRALPLRVWLVIVLVAVSSIGLLGSSLAVHYAMRGVLMEQVDEELRSSAVGWTQNPEIYQSGVVRPPTQFSVVAITPEGLASFLYDDGSRPDFTELEVGAPPQTVGSLPGSASNDQWRAMGAVNESGVIIIVGKNLSSQRQLLGGLSAVQLTISAIALVVMALIGAGFIRRALQPLREVERTAQAISAGEIHRRVPYWSPDTEVGQLSMSINIMLARLQESLESAKNSAHIARDKEAQMRRFVGDASHELRTPLTSVRGYVELYRSGATKDVDLVMDRIDAESGRMKLLVEDLLALTRAEGSRLEKTSVDLLELTLSAAASGRAAWPGRGIEVVNDTSGIPIVNGDPDRLHQVITNLINNGLKHGGEEASVTIRLHRDPAEPGRELIDVIDDGGGMSEETASHIFERFYRADSSRFRGTGGSGLGLAIVRSLVEMHDGTVKVASKEGEGTTFRISLPQKMGPRPSLPDGGEAQATGDHAVTGEPEQEEADASRRG
ncbi:sensor histidine kinase [Corynebacterium guangdongense]|uniref:histidine kinase n=1 Tax=Corynebacterium guangdongense TaxID=1783348 RepID=A0ABU1ZZP8_9CORY|nr:HAMP domain-containing sensor histidine kinase [Corynebacterium guangdongense]MDR7330245.1 two-component system OmpR family sensor kinase [Corynebacterium guangdongense]WJZ18803.1 putative sensor histidine kinase TcrY [Corynebacterium guangdongense]